MGNHGSIFYHTGAALRRRGREGSSRGRRRGPHEEDDATKDGVGREVRMGPSRGVLRVELTRSASYGFGGGGTRASTVRALTSGRPLIRYPLIKRVAAPPCHSTYRCSMRTTTLTTRQRRGKDGTHRRSQCRCNNDVPHRASH